MCALPTPSQLKFLTLPEQVECSFSSFFNEGSSLDDVNLDEIKKGLIMMLEDPSHITLKIRQCVNCMYLNKLTEDSLDSTLSALRE